MSPKSVKCAPGKVTRKGRKVVGVTVVTRVLGERIPRQERRRRTVETMIPGKNSNAGGAIASETGRSSAMRTRQSLDPEALDGALLLQWMEKHQRRKKKGAHDIIKNADESRDTVQSDFSSDEGNSSNNRNEKLKRPSIIKSSIGAQTKSEQHEDTSPEPYPEPDIDCRELKKASTPPLEIPEPLDEPNIKVSSPTASSPTCRPLLTNTTHAPLESLRNVLEGYDHSRIYLAHVSFLDWRDLPGRRTIPGERVWVVGAADHGGRHRTRILVAGRHWRPRCLLGVNMITQPVVYAGGGSGSLTADLFLWWFHQEFATTAIAMHPDGAILVAESADYLPSEVECVTADGLVRLFIVPKDCLEPRIVANELRVRLATGLLTRVHCQLDMDEKANSILENEIKKFSLKEAFAELHRAWLSIHSETFARSWMLLQEHEDARVSSPAGALALGRCSLSNHHCDDQQLTAQLCKLANEVGIEAGDIELQKWILDEESELAKRVMKCERDSNDDDENIDSKDSTECNDTSEVDVPSADETVQLLSRVLLWMERAPLDPGLLLAIRSMRDVASVMVRGILLTAK